MLKKIKLFEEFSKELNESLSDIKDINEISNKIISEVYNNSNKYKFNKEEFNQKFEDLLFLIEKNFNKSPKSMKVIGFDSKTLEYFGKFFEGIYSGKYLNRLVTVKFKSLKREYLLGGAYYPSKREIVINTDCIVSWVNTFKDLGYNPTQMLKRKDYETDWLMLLENEYLFKSTLQHELQHFIDNMKDYEWNKKAEDVKLKKMRELDDTLGRFDSAYARYLNYSYEIEARYIQDISKYELEEFSSFDEFWDEIETNGMIDLEQMFHKEIEQVILDDIKSSEKKLDALKSHNMYKNLPEVLQVHQDNIDKAKSKLNKYIENKEKSIKKIKDMYLQYWKKREENF